VAAYQPAIRVRGSLLATERAMLLGLLSVGSERVWEGAFRRCRVGFGSVVDFCEMVSMI